MTVKRKYKVACFGGTFDIPTHKGHEALIKKAFEVAYFCHIGLCTDFYIECKAKENVNKYGKREKNLEKYLSSKKISKKRYNITELENFYGPEAISKDVEAIIVSKKTIPGARGINEIRLCEGLKPLDIIEIDMVLGKDNEPISSTKIREMKMDKE
ncbi:MAG: pantetheine-phosphate adenylyltransferase [Candidatus Peribacteraceae bacterium]|nr:pantetheine-phosphate adenylyltransferase [Candidatus Peribacteraceae bacterium]